MKSRTIIMEVRIIKSIKTRKIACAELNILIPMVGFIKQAKPGKHNNVSKVSHKKTLYNHAEKRHTRRLCINTLIQQVAPQIYW